MQNNRKDSSADRDNPREMEWEQSHRGLFEWEPLPYILHASMLLELFTWAYVHILLLQVAKMIEKVLYRCHPCVNFLEPLYVWAKRNLNII